MALPVIRPINSYNHKMNVIDRVD